MAEAREQPELPHEPVGLLALVLGQLGDSERRIVRRIDENAGAASERWARHDREHEDLAKAVKAIGDRLEAHLDEHHDDELVLQARLVPIRNAAGLVRREWRTIVIVGLLAVDLVGQIATTLHLTAP